MAGIGYSSGYSPYTGAGNLALAMGANPSFGGATGGYQEGGYTPSNVGGVNYSSSAPSGYAWGASGLVPIGAGQAGIQAYNPAIATSPTRSFQAPSFTNSMSNWLGGGDISAWTPSSSGDFQLPGGGGSVNASSFDQNSMMNANSGQRGGTYGSVSDTLANMAGNAYGDTLANRAGINNGFGWPSVSDPVAALTSGIYGQESTYGTNPRAMSMIPNQYGARGPMQMTPQGAAQYAPGLNINTPAGNMAAGSQMVGGLLRQFGNPTSAAAAYNWGPTAVTNNPSPSSWPSSVQTYANNAVNAAGQWGTNAGFGALSNQALQNAGAQPSGRY